MKLFKSIRLSYLEDRDKDPEVQKSIEEIFVENGFIFGLTDSNGWNQSVIDQIPEIVRQGPYVLRNWDSQEWGGADEVGEFVSEGKWASLSPEENLGKTAIWHKKTRTVIFINKNILTKMNSNLDFKRSFLTNLINTLGR